MSTLVQSTCPQHPGSVLRAGWCRTGSHRPHPNTLGRADRGGVPISGGAR